MKADCQIEWCCATSTTSKKLGFYDTGCFFIRFADGIKPISPGFRYHHDAEKWCESMKIQANDHPCKPDLIRVGKYKKEGK